MCESQHAGCDAERISTNGEISVLAPVPCCGSSADSMQVVSEACGDRSPEIHNANMFDMNAKMADVVSEAEAIERLETGWSK